jgi:hypothetical protein
VPLAGRQVLLHDLQMEAAGQGALLTASVTLQQMNCGPVAFEEAEAPAFVSVAAGADWSFSELPVRHAGAR